MCNTVSDPDQPKVALTLTWCCRHPSHRVAEYGLHGIAPAARQLPAGDTAHEVRFRPSCHVSPWSAPGMSRPEWSRAAIVCSVLSIWHVSRMQTIKDRLVCLMLSTWAHRSQDIGDASVCTAVPGTRAAEAGASCLRTVKAVKEPKETVNFAALIHSAGGLQQEPMRGQC